MAWDTARFLGYPADLRGRHLDRRNEIQHIALTDRCDAVIHYQRATGQFERDYLTQRLMKPLTPAGFRMDGQAKRGGGKQHEQCRTNCEWDLLLHHSVAEMFPRSTTRTSSSRKHLTSCLTRSPLHHGRQTAK